MYGGLFGDLPAAKKDGDASATSGSSTQKGGDESSTSKAASTTANGPALRKTKTSASATSMFLPPAARKMKPAPSSQILQAVGTAGTSFAFVPTALKRKRPNRFAKLVETPKAGVPLTSPDPSTFAAPQQSVSAVAMASGPTASSSSSQPFVFESLSNSTTTTATGHTSSSSFQKVRNIHEESSDISPELSGPTVPIDKEGLVREEAQQNHHHQQQQQQDDVTAEVDDITDPYDPYVPNDLLQYWDRQALAKERAALERETREALESQRMLRQQLEQEREELQRKGDYHKLLQEEQQQQQQQQARVLLQQAGRGGRGRGRGLSNLPAWLVEKQRKEREEGLGGAP